MVDDAPLVRMEGISKNFGGLRALKNVDVELRAGEVMGILGHNGAGKSTLIKILAGAEQADAGRIFIRGEEVEISNPNDARDHGIETIYQELALCGNLDAPANLFMGRETERFGVLDKRYMHKETGAIPTSSASASRPWTWRSKSCPAASGSRSPSAARSISTPES